MKSPISGPVTITQLFGSWRGGPGEAYTALHGKSLYQNYGHNGIDFDAPIGTDVQAMKGGILTIPPGDPWQGGYGYGLGTYAVITLPNGELHRYGHLSAILLPHGSPVSENTVFAKSGNTGNTTGPHLHVSVLPAPLDYANGFDGCIDFLTHFDHGLLSFFRFTLV